MRRVWYFIWLLWQILLMSVVNRSYALGLAITLLLFMGLVILGVQISAPFIYTLF